MAACGSSSNTYSFDKLSCIAAEDPALGSDPMCVDSGVRQDSLFSFSNWGGHRYESDDFGYSELVGLYGAKAVCGSAKAVSCVPLPKAKVLRDVLNNLEQNGRCEGISVLGALYMTSKGPNLSTFDASSVNTLTPQDAALNNVIDYWWSSQFMKSYLSYANKVRKGGVTKVLNEIINGLAQKNGVTIGIYSKHAGHSILPVAVARHSMHEFYVFVWDSNMPKSLGRMTINTATHKWTYQGARVNPGQNPTVWSGGDGDIDAAPLNTRRGAAAMNLGSGKGSTTVVATASPGKNVQVTISTKDGKQLVASASGSTGGISGAKVDPLKNGDSTQIIIQLPSSVSKFTATAAVSGNGYGTMSADQLSINPSQGNPVSVVLPISAADSTTKIDLSSTAAAKVNSSESTLVTTATEKSAIQLQLPANNTAEIATATSATTDATITVTNQTGQQSVTTVDAAAAGTQDVAISANADGSIKKTTTAGTAINVNQPGVSSFGGSTSNSTPNTASILPSTTTTSTLPVNTDGAKVSSTLTSIGNTTALVTSKVVAPGDVTYYVEYGPTDQSVPNGKTANQSVSSSNGGFTTVTALMKGLAPATTYQYRAIIKAPGIAYVSPWTSFTTLSSTDTTVPDSTTSTPTTVPSAVITTPTGSLNAKVNIFGITADATSATISSNLATETTSIGFYLDYGIDDGSATTRTQTQRYVTEYLGPKSYRALPVTTLTGLQPNTRYRVRPTIVGPSNDWSTSNNFLTFVTDPVTPTNVVPVGGMGTITVSWNMPANPSGEQLLFTATADDGSTCTVMDDSSCTITGLTQLQQYSVRVTTTVVSTGVTSNGSSPRSVYAALPAFQTFVGAAQSGGFRMRSSFLASGNVYSYIIQVREAGTTALVLQQYGNGGASIDSNDPNEPCASGPNGVYCTKADSVTGLQSGTTYEIRLVASANNSTYFSNWLTFTAQ